MSTLILNGSVRQEQQLAPRLVQSARILQMDIQELQTYIEHLAEENPVFELEYPAHDPLSLSAVAIPSGRSISSGAQQAEHSRPAEPGKLDTEAESLSSFLRDQLERLKLQPELSSLCSYLAELPDENGYLRPEEIDSARDLGVPEPLLLQAIQILQSLEPAGVCAADLRECLLLQLRGKDACSQLARHIVCDHLENLSRQRYSIIARSLHISESEVREAAERIRALNPHPGAPFRTESPIQYICPDVSITERGGTLIPLLNRLSTPRITISETYLHLLQDTDDPYTRTYLSEKLRQAHWVVSCLERRCFTLQRCAAEILTIQWDYFTCQSDELVPMTLQSVARHLGIHETTVCRAVRGKYLQCRRGIFPMDYFFTHAATNGVSGQAVQAKLAELIRSEHPEHPYSDQELAQLLAEEGMPIARRTVTKYREQLHLPSARERKIG